MRHHHTRNVHIHGANEADFGCARLVPYVYSQFNQPRLELITILNTVLNTAWWNFREFEQVGQLCTFRASMQRTTVSSWRVR